MQKRKVVNRDRLRAVCQARRLSWQQLARAAGVSHPTLSRINSGRVKAVNPPTLARLAAALGVSEAWLTGEQQHLPYVGQWGAVRNAAGKPVSRREWPTIDQVRYSWLMQRIETAVRRDLEGWYGAEAGPAFDSWGRGLLFVCDQMASDQVWRRVATIPKENHDVPLVSDNAPAVQWLMQMLEPWLEGKAYLNVEPLQNIFSALKQVGRRSPILWGDALRGLEHYAKAVETLAQGGKTQLSAPEPRRKHLWEKLRKSGSIEDAAAVILPYLKEVEIKRASSGDRAAAKAPRRRKRPRTRRSR